MRAWTLATLLACALTGAAHAAASADASLPVFDLSASAEMQAPSHIETDGRKRLPAAGRIAIVSFVVEFVDTHATRPPAPAHVAITLDRDQLQPIVDTLYDSVVEDLTSQDRAVIPAAEADALPGHLKLVPVLVKPPASRESSDDSGKRTALFVSAYARPALIDDASPASLAAQATASKLDAVTLVSVRLVVDFLLPRKQESPAYAQTIRAGESHFRLTRPDGSAFAAVLKKSVRAPVSPIAPGKAGGYDVGEAADVTSDVEQLAVDTAVYYDQALRYLDATQDMMIAAIGSQLPGASSRQAASSGK
jgi:hypothetical protein